MDRIQNTNIIHTNNTYNKVNNTGKISTSSPKDSFEKSDAKDIDESKKIILALVGGIVALFALYKGVKYFKNIKKTKSVAGDEGVNAFEAAKPKKPKPVETPKETNIEGIAGREPESTEKIVSAADNVEDAMLTTVTREVQPEQLLKPTEKAEQLAEEYRKLIKERNYKAAFQKRIELKDEGFIIYKDKLVHKTSKEAFQPLETVAMQDLNSASELEKIVCPTIIKTEDPKFAKVVNPKNFGIENINAGAYDYIGMGATPYYHENMRLLAREGGMSTKFPEGVRSWLMGHDYLKNWGTGKYHYVTTLAFGEGLNVHGRPPGFILNLEGDHSIQTIEALKNRLIETGLVDDLILCESSKSGKKIMDRIIEEVIVFMNKI